jgi:hypothetical protein
MADARRIIFGTQVTPKETTTLEDGQVKEILLQTAKRLGSRGMVDTSEIQASQYGNGWTSMNHDQYTWENYSDLWEDAHSTWSGVKTISTVAKQLTGGHSGATDKDCAFCYIRNLGSTTLHVSLNTGGASEYDILVPGGGSVHFRGTSGGFHCDDIYAKCHLTGNTEIEYIIAKSEV